MYTYAHIETPQQATRMFGNRQAADFKFKFGIKRVCPFLYTVYFNDLEKHVHTETEAMTLLSAILKYHGYRPSVVYVIDHQYLYAEKL